MAASPPAAEFDAASAELATDATHALHDQDALDYSFGCIRSRGRSNNNPTVQLYAHRVQKIVVGVNNQE